MLPAQEEEDQSWMARAYQPPAPFNHRDDAGFRASLRADR
jgi:hypothetical protein